MTSTELMAYPCSVVVLYQHKKAYTLRPCFYRCQILTQQFMPVAAVDEALACVSIAPMYCHNNMLVFVTSKFEAIQSKVFWCSLSAEYHQRWLAPRARVFSITTPTAPASVERALPHGVRAPAAYARPLAPLTRSTRARPLVPLALVQTACTAMAKGLYM